MIILTRVSWNFRVFFSRRLVIVNIFFMYLLSNFTSYFKNCLFNWFTHWLNYLFFCAEFFAFLYIQTIISFAVQKCFNFVRSTCQLLLESRAVAVLFGKPLPLPIYWNISFYVFLYHLQWTKDFNVRPEIAIYFWFFFSCLKIKIPRVFFKNDAQLIITLQIFSEDGCSLGCQLIKNDTETYY